MSEMDAAKSINDLPNEVLAKILSHVSPLYIANCADAGRKLAAVVETVILAEPMRTKRLRRFDKDLKGKFEHLDYVPSHQVRRSAGCGRIEQSARNGPWMSRGAVQQLNRARVS